MLDGQTRTKHPKTGSIRVGSEHCSAFKKQVFNVQTFRPVFRSERSLNAPGEHFFISSNGGRRRRRRPPFEICDDVLARSVQIAFRSEHWSERLNAEHLFSER